jgi:outer membrane immunogenic protein
MTFSSCTRQLLLGAATAGAALTLAGNAGAQATRQGASPQPRLAWLGTDRTTFERSTGAYPAYGTRPGIWTGFYAGLDGGYAWAGAEPLDSSPAIDLDSAYAGGHLGYNWQWRSLVLGAEADAGWRWGEGGRTNADGSRLDVQASLLSSFRLRAGFAYDNLLVYATGGLALGQFEADLAAGTTLAGASETFAGWVVGGGLEMKLTPQMSGRVEALHYGFDDKSFGFSGGILRSDLSTTTVRAGISYHFN